MFAVAINLIVAELKAYIASTGMPGDPDEGAYVVPGNIAHAESVSSSSSIRQRVVASVVNLEEETTFKNATHVVRSGGTAKTRNAPTYLNLYVLFSANYEDYGNALRRISQVLTFFQGRNTFSFRDSPQQLNAGNSQTDVRLVMELMSLSFEQVNYLWASLGGKQMPFALYRMRLVKIQADFQQGESPLIENIAADETSV